MGDCYLLATAGVIQIAEGLDQSLHYQSNTNTPEKPPLSLLPSAPLRRTTENIVVA